MPRRDWKQKRLDAMSIVLKKVCDMLDAKLEHKKIKDRLLIDVFLISVGREDSINEKPGK